MPNRQESELERRRRQLEVISKKGQAASDRKDEEAMKACQLAYDATTARIAELEAQQTTEQPSRRARRGD